MDNTKQKRYTLSILTENKPGLLNTVIIVFTRRKINIEMINASPSEIEGISRYTIVITTTQEQVQKIVKQIRKHIAVIGAFVYEEKDIHYQEIALFKLPTEVFLGGTKIEDIVIRQHSARVLAIEKEYIVIEKTGHMHEIQQLLQVLTPLGLLEYVRSGRVAVSKSKRRTERFLEELDNATSNTL